MRSTGEIENPDSKPTIFNDLADQLLNFPDIPSMRRLDVYHNAESVLGFQVVYRGDPFLGKLEYKGNKNTATHVENFKRDSIYFQPNEYIINIKTCVKDFVERIELKTNQDRSFYFGNRSAVDN